MINVLIIIPCYNEEKNITPVIKKVNDYITGCPIPDIKFNYIIINDCSKDKTIALCNDNNYNYIDLPINLGIGGAVQTGYRWALENGYDIAIQHDGDGQHDSAFFSDILVPILSDKADIVIGSRFIEKHGFQSTGLRRFGISLLSFIIRICSGVRVYDVTSGYRAVNKEFINLFAFSYAQDYPEPEAIVDAAANNAKIVEIPVIMQERAEGKSSINALKSIHYMIKVSLSILLHKLIISKKQSQI